MKANNGAMLINKQSAFFVLTQYRLCQQLWCEIEGEKLCRSKLNPPATGTACATGKVGR